MRWRNARGQTASEFLMIVGLITAISIIVLSVAHPAFRKAFRSVSECVLGDVCEGGSSGGGGSGSGGGSGGRGSGGAGPIGTLPWVDPSVRLCLNPQMPPGCSKDGGYVEEAWCIAQGKGYQNCKALRKRMNCACGNCEECDGSVTQAGSGMVVCVHNDTEGKVYDLAEAKAMIDDVTRMINGQAPLLTENDAIAQMKRQIVDALRSTPANKEVELIGHSQGAAVLSNALWQLRREGAISAADWDRLNVVALGPAEMRFPPELETVRVYVSDDDPVDGIGEYYLKQSQNLNAGSVAEPDKIQVTADNPYGIAVKPCTSGIAACHGADRYLAYHTEMEKVFLRDFEGTTVTSAIGRTVMVNGIDTTFDDHKASCETYAHESAHVQQGVLGPNKGDIYVPGPYRR